MWCKKIALISLLIFLIVTLFISCAYLLLCQNKKSSLNLDELRNEKRRTPLLDSQNKQQTISPSSRSLASPANSVTGYERNILLVTTLFTDHDQFDETHSRYITSLAIEMLKLLGFNHCNSHGYYGSTVYFDKTAISNSIFVANHAIYGDSFSVSYTHQTYSRYDESCTTCKVIMKFNSASAPNSYEYLVTNRPYKGKTLNIRAGHTTGFTEAEKKIFLSSILWLLYEI